jgi:type II secretory pathway pseudopilin PulG
MNKPNPQSGQTMIETITALFILSMALVAGLSLAIYAATQSTNNRDEVIATNLAREGLEAVRMMRDSNWLAAEDSGAVDDLYTTNGGCTYSADPTQNRPCYPEAFDEPYDIESTATGVHYRLVYNPATPTGFSLDPRNGVETFLLCLIDDGTYRHLTPANANCNSLASGNLPIGRFGRSVTISHSFPGYPYTPSVSNPVATGASPNFGGHSPEKVITSTVVWEGRGCASFPVDSVTINPATFTTKCKITMIERLSNWKDYE